MNATNKASMNDAGKAGTKEHDAEGLVSKSKHAMEDAAHGAMDMARDGADAMSDAAETGASRVGSVLNRAQQAAQDAKDAVVSGAGSTLATVRDVAVEKADVARESLSDVGERIAATLERASGEQDSDALKSRVMSSMAQGISTASNALRNRSVSDLTADVKGLARRHPGAFMAAAAVAGFAAARFVRSSARRRSAEMDESRGRHS